MPRRALLAGMALVLMLVPAARAADPLRPQQWNLDMVEADAAHGVATGAGATVAVVDTGVHLDHQDLRGRLALGRDFVDGDDQPQDENEHGTHVAGIVAATKDNGIGVSSVAPGARVLVIRALDERGEGLNADVAAGIDYARTHGAKVINLSVGSLLPLVGTLPEPDLDPALDRALDAGIVVVASAGNNGAPVCEQPAAEGRLLCVGAVDRDGLRSGYSSSPGGDFGRSLGVMAPGGSGAGTVLAGEDVLSTLFDPARSSATDLYGELAGTSQAAPHVAGVAALLAQSGVTGQAAVRRILATARDAGTPGPDPVFGAGIVNARAAVAGTGGGGGGSPGGGAGPGAGADGSAVFRARRVYRWRTVRRRGLAVRCRSAGDGRCRVRARLGRRTIAAGSARLSAGRTRTVRVRLNRRGRRLARRARRTRVTLRATLPGAPVRKRRATIRR